MHRALNYYFWMFVFAAVIVLCHVILHGANGPILIFERRERIQIAKPDRLKNKPQYLQQNIRPHISMGPRILKMPFVTNPNFGVLKVDIKP